MEVATQTHLTALRSALQFRLHELATELHAADAARQADMQGPGVEVGDRKDEATRRQASDIDEAEAQRDFEEARLVQAALKRMDDGVFGDCLGCGESIPLARLQVQPAAPLCAACQSAKERRPPGAGQSARG